jgi:hypothetical protein
VAFGIKALGLVGHEKKTWRRQAPQSKSHRSVLLNQRELGIYCHYFIAIIIILSLCPFPFPISHFVSSPNTCPNITQTHFIHLYPSHPTRSKALHRKSLSAAATIMPTKVALLQDGFVSFGPAAFEVLVPTTFPPGD